MKVDVRLVFGKNELQPEEINWLRTLPSVHTSFCRNLHAKCYLNEDLCILTSLNLYDFNQANNSEMGILIGRTTIRSSFQRPTTRPSESSGSSDEVRMSFDKVKRVTEDNAPNSEEEQEGVGKLSTSRLAKKLGLKTQELTDHLRASRRDRDQRWPETDYAARPPTRWRVAGQRAFRAVFSLARGAAAGEDLTEGRASARRVFPARPVRAPEYTRGSASLRLTFRRFRDCFLRRLETDLRMRAVAKRFLRRGAAAAKRHPFLDRKGCCPPRPSIPPRPSRCKGRS